MKPQIKKWPPDYYALVQWNAAGRRSEDSPWEIPPEKSHDRQAAPAN